MESDFYEILQVSPRAEPDVIDAAYRRLAHRYHPDVNPEPEAAERMKEINVAFDTLSDSHKRYLYDASKNKTQSSYSLTLRSFP